MEIVRATYVLLTFLKMDARSARPMWSFTVFFFLIPVKECTSASGLVENTQCQSSKVSSWSVDAETYEEQMERPKPLVLNNVQRKNKNRTDPYRPDRFGT